MCILCKEFLGVYLGICLGMQIAVIEFARNVAKMKYANSTEFDAETKYPVVGLISEWLDSEGSVEKRDSNSDLGGTMRLGSQECVLKKDSLTRKMYKASRIMERHRHRYEVNNNHIDSRWGYCQGEKEKFCLRCSKTLAKYGITLHNIWPFFFDKV